MDARCRSKLLSEDRIDEATVLAKLDEVTAIERDVKKVNSTLLVRVKNQLDPEQQVKVRSYRPTGMMVGGGRHGPPRRMAPYRHRPYGLRRQ